MPPWVALFVATLLALVGLVLVVRLAAPRGSAGVLAASVAAGLNLIVFLVRWAGTNSRVPMCAWAYLSGSLIPVVMAGCAWFIAPTWSSQEPVPQFMAAVIWLAAVTLGGLAALRPATEPGS